VLYKIRYLLLLVLLGITTLDAGWLNRKAEGWAWYEDVKKTPQGKEREEEGGSPSSEDLSPSERMKDVQEGLEDKKALAVLEPTVENVGEYIKAQHEVLEQTDKFTQSWAKFILLHPEYDNTIKYPTAQYSNQVYKKQKRDAKNALFNELSKDHGFFFFFKGEEMLSQAFAGVVKMFADRFDWSVLPVSLDGYSVSEFPDAHINTAMVENLGVEITPALYVYSVSDEEFIPVAFGAISIDALEDHIVLQFADPEEEK